jgi:hypothetical protein
MESQWLIGWLWVLAAGLVGFGLSAVFAGWLHLPRRLFILPYTLISGAFFYAFLRWNAIDPVDLVRRNWAWGLIGALAVGVFVVKNVLSQGRSAHARGWLLALDVLWLGVVYGLVDALLLSVVPVLAAWQSFARLGWTVSWAGKAAFGISAILASLWVTAAYHFGYPEFRNPQLAKPVFGNGVMSLGYLLTGNPIAALFSHIAMHIAAVLHGPDTAAQLPPHAIQPR